MNQKPQHTFPRWAFAILAICGLLASGIVIGIMTKDGVSGIRLVQAAGFGSFGLLMFWGALSRP